MKIALIQTFLHWENRDKNLDHFSSLISGINENCDLIVLPEMFTTGFTMEPERVAEENGLETLQWMKTRAEEKNAVITGSVSVEDNAKYYNRLFWVTPSGEHSVYDKKHLFRMAKEDHHYTAGTEKIITGIKDWKFCPLVCYDLRFPIWCRNRFTKTSETSTEAEYDVLLFVANWPTTRAYAWKQLLVARAIENQCYVVGVNRVGKDGNGYDHSGDSAVIDPKGQVISETKSGEDRVEVVKLDMQVLEDYRKAFPVGLDADDFEMG